MEPLRRTPSLQADLRLTPQAVARLSPAFFPRPKGSHLYAAVGLDESDEFLRHNRLIRDVWGPTAVPVCETVPRANHFSVLNSLVDPAGRLLAGFAMSVMPRTAGFNTIDVSQMHAESWFVTDILMFIGGGLSLTDRRLHVGVPVKARKQKAAVA